METCPLCLDDQFDGDTCAACGATRCPECHKVHRDRRARRGPITIWCRKCIGEAAAEERAQRDRDDRMTGDR